MSYHLQLLKLISVYIKHDIDTRYQAHHATERTYPLVRRATNSPSSCSSPSVRSNITNNTRRITEDTLYYQTWNLSFNSLSQHTICRPWLCSSSRVRAASVSVSTACFWILLMASLVLSCTSLACCRVALLASLRSNPLILFLLFLLLFLFSSDSLLYLVRLICVLFLHLFLYECVSFGLYAYLSVNCYIIGKCKNTTERSWERLSLFNYRRETIPLIVRLLPTTQSSSRQYIEVAVILLSFRQRKDWEERIKISLVPVACYLNGFRCE